MSGESLGSVRRAFAPWTDPDAKPFVCFKGVTKRFGPVMAVDAVSLDIFEREFFSLLGPSGCGKTTLLRMLAGFETANTGYIFLDGVNISEVPPHRRPVNMMFQSYALFPHMTVEQNIAFGLRQESGVSKAAMADRTAEMLKLVQLEGYGKRRPNQLSGGQQQRVALARSLAKRPKVLLLDEPLGALDKKLREETQFELMDLQMDLGLTFIIVTHDQEEAMTVSDRIAVMNEGRLVQVATPGEIYEQPKTRYVADFLGSINLFDGTLASRNGAAAVVETGAAGPLHVLIDEGTELAGSATIGVRPEKINIGFDRPNGAGRLNTVKGEIWDIAYYGDLSTYHVKLSSGTIVKVTVTNTTRLVERPIGWDDEVWLAWPPEAGILIAE